jgi:hypothetical protein
MSNMKREAIEIIMEAFQKLEGNPLEDMRKMGRALIEIADALEGKTTEESIRIIKGVAALEGIQL